MPTSGMKFFGLLSTNFPNSLIYNSDQAQHNPHSAACPQNHTIHGLLLRPKSDVGNSNQVSRLGQFSNSVSAACVCDPYAALQSLSSVAAAAAKGSAAAADANAAAAEAAALAIHCRW